MPQDGIGQVGSSMALREIRKEKADARRAMIQALTEQVITLLRDSGASEEEGLAALDCAKIILPLQEMDSCIMTRYCG